MLQNSKAKPNKRAVSLGGLVLFFACFFILLFGLWRIIFAQEQDITISADTAWEAGTYTYNNVLITNGATLTLNGVVIINARVLTIDSACSISANGKGYLAAEGPGAGGVWGNVYYGGGGCGGKGGGLVPSGGSTYGSAIAPVDLGSGGGRAYWGGAGGGAIKLTVNNLIVNGKVTANGEDGKTSSENFRGGGGSGGSVYIITNQFNGSGLITANGGGGYYGGGGGGRVVVYYSTSTFSGKIESKGGTGRASGEDGTTGFFDIQNSVFYAGSVWRFQENDGPFINFSKVILNNSRVVTEGNIILNTNELIISNNSNIKLGGVTSGITLSSLNLNSSSLTLTDHVALTLNNFTINNSSLTLDGQPKLNINNPSLEIKNNSSLTFLGAQTLNIPSLTINGNSTLILSGSETLNVNAVNLMDNSIITHLPQGKISLGLPTLIIDATSSISANGKGYLAAEGPGAGGVWGDVYYGGGGYGGKGGGLPPSGGSSYGSAIAPVDLGSGGGRAYWGGAGGGAIKLTVDNLILNGKVTANGEDGKTSPENFLGGGGSGGSIYIIANQLSGSGLITANGGNAYYGGGGGGRVAVYYSASTFSGKAESKGGTGRESGGDGTVILPTASVDTPITAFTLFEKSFTASTLSATLSTQQITLNNVIVKGDLSGTLNFTNLEIIKIETGSFSGKGFSKGEYETTLEGLNYKGIWNGITYFIPSEDKIYLKGEISGDINGICDGYISESISQSGNYDKYLAVWKINRIGTQNVSVICNLDGALSFQSPYTFTSGLYLYQGNMEGNAFGYYTGPLSAVVTHLRLTDENEYKGEGFSIISYNSALGQGDAWAYNQFVSIADIEFQGLFKGPLLGKFTGALDENKAPKILSGTVERLDFGAVPKPDLKVKAWSPTRVSPGQTITYVIEYRNDGLKAADNVFVSCLLNTFEKYVYASEGFVYSPYAHRLSWKIPTLAAKSSGFLIFQTEITWGLPARMPLNAHVFITNTGG